MTEDNFICGICGGSSCREEVCTQKCGHEICWKCLTDYVLSRLAPRIKCPSASCAKYLSDFNIRKVLSDEDIKKYEQSMFNIMDSKMKCLLPECSYLLFYTDTNVQYDCPECSLFNCLYCGAAHRFLSCSQYQSEADSRTYCDEEINRARKSLKRKQNSKMFRELEEMDILFYDKSLECPNCCRYLPRGEAIRLRCSHSFCRYCLSSHVKSSNVPILCLSSGCNKPIQEREILQLISEDDLQIYIDRCNSVVKGKLNFIFHCQTQDCTYFVEYSSKPATIYCTLCEKYNCTKCYSSHPSETCEQFKLRNKNTPYGISLLSIENQILRKKLMRCLKCHHILKKIAGCSWIQCSNCKFEMCWALQMRRWGPKGRNDISDGCRCYAPGYGPCSPNCGSCQPHN